jgi:hypothetical protein
MTGHQAHNKSDDLPDPVMPDEEFLATFERGVIRVQVDPASVVCHNSGGSVGMGVCPGPNIPPNRMSSETADPIRGLMKSNCELWNGPLP